MLFSYKRVPFIHAIDREVEVMYGIGSIIVVYRVTAKYFLIFFNLKERGGKIIQEHNQNVFWCLKRNGIEALMSHYDYELIEGIEEAAMSNCPKPPGTRIA